MEGSALIYKLPLMGLCKLKVQINNGPKGFVKEREKDHVVKSKKIEAEFIYEVSKEKEKLCEEDI
jgi:hypothetical protein